MDSFTEEEQKTLAPFMTNLDKPVFALTNLPEVVKGALFSRYSRSAKSLRRVLLDEFILQPETGFREIVGHAENKGTESSIAIRKAEEFYDRVLVGYGDDSVAELASVHVALEDISNIATKVIEDRRIGFSPLEKSTRYVYFDQQVQGQWLYCREPTLMESGFASLYTRTCDRLFETYARLIPKVSAWAVERNPQTDASDRAYKSAIRAKTCDILRGLLPASTRTNMGAMGNGRAFEYLLTRLYAQPLREMNDIAAMLHAELGKVIPSFVKRAGERYGLEQQAYWKEMDRTLGPMVSGYRMKQESGGSQKGVVLVQYDKDAEVKVVAHILYAYSGVPLEACYEKARAMPETERTGLIAAYAGKRGNRRHKPGRAFENTGYTFDILANFGAYRDLQRHRVLTQERQLLSCNHGYTFPPELAEAGFKAEFKDAMEMAKQAYDEISVRHPQEAQYVVPLAYNIRWYFTLNLREAIHLAELRSMQQGHVDYRRIAQGMYREIHRVHPVFAQHMKFMDMKEYGMERLEAEKKIDKKMEEMDRKYGKEGQPA